MGMGGGGGGGENHFYNLDEKTRTEQQTSVTHVSSHEYMHESTTVCKAVVWYTGNIYVH